MDFKEDQLAIEAHVRMRSGWRDIDEISEEEYLEYAYEYMAEHPFESWLVVNKREAIIYDRIDGQFWAMRTFQVFRFYGKRVSSGTRLAFMWADLAREGASVPREFACWPNTSG